MTAALRRFFNLVLISGLIASFALALDIGATPTASAQVCPQAVTGTVGGSLSVNASSTPASITGTVTNSSSTCAYQVGIASYMIMQDGSIDTQVLFQARTATVDPNSTRALSVDLPVCAAQVDLFSGPVLNSLNGLRYGDRLISFQHFAGNGLCSTASIGGGSSAPQVLPTTAPIPPAAPVPTAPVVAALPTAQIQFTAGGTSDTAIRVPTSVPVTSAQQVAVIPPSAFPPITGPSLPPYVTPAEVAGAMVMPQPQAQSGVAPSQDIRAPEIAPITVPQAPVEAVIPPVEAIIPAGETLEVPVADILVPPEAIEAAPALLQQPPAQVRPVQQVPRPVAAAPAAQARPVQQMPAAQRLPRTGGAPIGPEVIGMLGLALFSTGLLIRRRGK